MFVLLGSGDKGFENKLKNFSHLYPDKIAITLGYNESLAHLIEAGADIFLMPSRFEPCGLNQMYSQRYGTIPIVRSTGGLADTVHDVSVPGGTGFTFGPIDLGHFSAVLDRALGLREHFPAEWAAAQLRAMGEDNSWDRAGRDYIDLYRAISCP